MLNWFEFTGWLEFVNVSLPLDLTYTGRLEGWGSNGQQPRLDQWHVWQVSIKGRRGVLNNKGGGEHMVLLARGSVVVWFLQFWPRSLTITCDEWVFEVFETIETKRKTYLHMAACAYSISIHHMSLSKVAFSHQLKCSCSPDNTSVMTKDNNSELLANCVLERCVWLFGSSRASQGVHWWALSACFFDRDEWPNWRRFTANIDRSVVSCELLAVHPAATRVFPDDQIEQTLRLALPNAYVEQALAEEGLIRVINEASLVVSNLDLPPVVA